jgi:ssDNA-binding replication factor A large subunit
VGSVGGWRSGIWYEMLCCIARPSRRQGRAMRGGVRAEARRRVYSGPRLPVGMASSPPPKTFISDLRPSRVASIEATVVQLEQIREITQRDGAKKKVRNGKLKDGTGEISFVLWGEEVDLVSEGDKIRIVEGWVKDYQGKPQISLGRTGKLEKVPVG